MSSNSDFPLLPRTQVVPLWIDFRAKTRIAVDRDHTTPLPISYISSIFLESVVAKRVAPPLVNISEFCLEVITISKDRCIERNDSHMPLLAPTFNRTTNR